MIAVARRLMPGLMLTTTRPPKPTRLHSTPPRPPPAPPEPTKDKLRRLAGGPSQPLTICLRQEIERLNRVVAAAGEALRGLQLAIAGTIALSEELAEALDALAGARVPKRWLKISWEASGLGTWFAGLLQRHEQLHRWLHAGRPRSFWLPGLFNAQGFLTAVKQEITRKHAAERWSLGESARVCVHVAGARGVGRGQCGAAAALGLARAALQARTPPPTSPHPPPNRPTHPPTHTRHPPAHPSHPPTHPPSPSHPHPVQTTWWWCQR